VNIHGITALRRFMRRLNSALRMSCDSSRDPSSEKRAAEAPFLIAVVRNEMLRLPRFLDHYRKLGVRCFHIIENNSTDETAEYLRGQIDVTLHRTGESFTKKESWIDLLLHRYGVGRWCLVVDADELLDYPDSDQVPLPELCRYLEEGGKNALHALLLDLYPQTPPQEVAYKPGTDYFTMEWFFDPPEMMTKVPRHFWKGSGLDYRFEGGMRERVFGIRNCCSKFPLFRFSKGMYLHDGQHYLEGAHVSGLRGVLHHFKYLQDFVPHVREEARRGEHWRDGSEYKQYARVMDEREGGVNFHFPGSIRYLEASQMEALGVTKRPAGYLPPLGVGGSTKS